MTDSLGYHEDTYSDDYIDLPPVSDHKGLVSESLVAALELSPTKSIRITAMDKLGVEREFELTLERGHWINCRILVGGFPFDTKGFCVACLSRENQTWYYAKNFKRALLTAQPDSWYLAVHTYLRT